jgi:Uri superfamily endonuclease
MNKGAYQLIIEVLDKTKISIGKLGAFDFDKGIYVYTGSAMNNLQARIDRHATKEKILKWHIDYLLADRFVNLLDIIKYPSEQKLECVINLLALQKFKSEVPIPKFGSSDCNICPSHLLKIEDFKYHEFREFLSKSVL